MEIKTNPDFSFLEDFSHRQVPGGRLAEFAGSKRVFGWTMAGVSLSSHLVFGTKLWILSPRG